MTIEFSDNLLVENMTFTALARFARATATIMEAEGLSPEQRVALIRQWAYQYYRPDMPELLAGAIVRCQGDPDDLLISASSGIDAVTGNTVAFSPTTN